ncbi:hypothetical protein MesoLj113c_32390 [Mesorhizobium sp. 113-3-9]|uniref:DUF3800 domain-containing protein n=1 Tax=Mesorhizobium sp. 113-3-9 TaxID=2744517 RepID=UPI0019282B9E|nr:DUF3800 domain-containing protein [Mesorhizobium sp. 113-3-9]BCG87129.1 hypothetical protein MesoLj113c_32390 [Mesorhizobium sp. 113-3-9]
MHYIIYCDESNDKGRYYSNFYGGALLRGNDRELIEARLSTAKAATKLQGEIKWTKISEYNEACYTAVIDEVFSIIRDGLLKIRIMFTQNINQNSHVNYEVENEYFMLYYQFVKHAFGLRYCNPQRTHFINASVYLDKVPQKLDDFDTFKQYMSGLSDYPVFKKEKVRIRKEDITDIDSFDHIILQMVDVILGSMQFRLNEHHKDKPEGKKRRGKRTKAKERVYKHINAKIREVYPGFNIGTSTGQAGGDEDRWRHQYRHWCFVPKGSRVDLARGKKPRS